MAAGHQYYDADGAPLDLPVEPSAAVAAWQSHRPRLRNWFAELPDDRWSAPTRCEEWGIAEMVQHLVVGARFLSYTLREARGGRPTRLLEGFDPKTAPAALVAGANERPHAELLADLVEADASVDAEIADMDDKDWSRHAESPAGHVPATLSLTHMLFDSWVHERDVMVPAGETPVTDPAEASIVAAYVFGLAGIARGADEGPHPDLALQLQLTDIDHTFVIQRAAGRVRVSAGATEAPVDASGTASDLVGYATGRQAEHEPVIDESAAAYLTNLVTRMN